MADLSGGAQESVMVEGGESFQEYEYIWVLGHVNIGGHWRSYEMIYGDYGGQ